MKTRQYSWTKIHLNLCTQMYFFRSIIQRNWRFLSRSRSRYTYRLKVKYSKVKQKKKKYREAGIWKRAPIWEEGTFAREVKCGDTQWLMIRRPRVSKETWKSQPLHPLLRNQQHQHPPNDAIGRTAPRFTQKNHSKIPKLFPFSLYGLRFIQKFFQISRKHLIARGYKPIKVRIEFTNIY